MNEILLHFAKGYTEGLSEEMAESAVDLAGELNALAQSPENCHISHGYQ